MRNERTYLTRPSRSFQLDVPMGVTTKVATRIALALLALLTSVASGARVGMAPAVSLCRVVVRVVMFVMLVVGMTVVAVTAIMLGRASYSAPTVEAAGHMPAYADPKLEFMQSNHNLTNNIIREPM